jgi:glycogen(starch) synthase
MPEAFAAADRGRGEDRLIAFAGRLVTEKGVDLLLRAMTLVPDARLEIVGDGPMRTRYQDLVEELGLSLRVSFLGSQSFEGVADAYRRAAVVCIPSLWDEPFGFVAAEAMAMQRPLVVTPSGALLELCAEERGFVAEHRTATALASALSEALADGNERARRAARARGFAERELSAGRAGSAYESVYEEVVA